MSDDRSSAKGSKDKANESAQQALSDYLDIMLGGVDDSPLASLEAAPETLPELRNETSSAELSHVSGSEAVPDALDEAFQSVGNDDARGSSEPLNETSQNQTSRDERLSKQDSPVVHTEPSLRPQDDLISDNAPNDDRDNLDGDSLEQTHSNFKSVAFDTQAGAASAERDAVESVRLSEAEGASLSDHPPERARVVAPKTARPSKPELPDASAEIKLPTLAPPKLAPAPLVKAQVQPKIESSAVSAQSKGKVSDKERQAIKEMLRQQRAAKEQKLQAALKARNLSLEDAVASRTVASTPETEAAPENAVPNKDAKQDGFAPPQWAKNGRPEWAQDRFECLLFTVAGLKLAVPLVSLGSIHSLDSELTPLVGRANWFLGLYRYGERNIRVVDTARWVMPQLHHAGVIENYKFVIRLGEGNWGVACDAVHEAIQLTPDQVKWRTKRSKRGWLSGTVIDHMCALLDADTLAAMLDFEVAQRVR